MTTQLGTRLPLIQGALAQISLPPLVSAVSNAGGLGVLTTVGLTPATLAAAIAAVQAATTQPLAST
ncbi:nitronate monooxygenase [Lacticaseibacillus nasuensis]|uniref:nitronate monooxygenase n=1 Tax=Lacticaseibacillus nasuensis TaxID=944671 RepID=UPI0006D1458E|nr:nitronate monooxygenase [Lacticaseibacillus nasuensis]